MEDTNIRWDSVSDNFNDAYLPGIEEDGRGCFPGDLRVKAPRGARAAVAAAAEIKNTSHSEYVRRVLLRCLEADGVRLRRGLVELSRQEDTQYARWEKTWSWSPTRIEEQAVR
jgi:hypothetical protein